MITQGKWEKTWRDIVVKDSTGGQFRICTMVQHIGEAEGEDVANACLIAAAPELLEACKYTIEKLKGVEGKTFSILPILQAIEKAEKGD